MPRILAHFFAARLLRRRSLSAALLVAYIITAVGVPLPAGGRRHSEELYPCAQSACGCASAEQCWRSCCCHSLSERFAWARKHQVRPPGYAIAAARCAGIDLAWIDKLARGPDPAAPAPPCCDHAALVATDERPTCCQSRAACSEGGANSCCAERSDQRQKSNPTDHIVTWRALACHGQSLNWLAATPTLVVARPSATHETVLVAWLGPAISDAAKRVATPPDVPPPERA